MGSEEPTTAIYTPPKSHSGRGAPWRPPVSDSTIILGASVPEGVLVVGSAAASPPAARHDPPLNDPPYHSLNINTSRNNPRVVSIMCPTRTLRYRRYDTTVSFVTFTLYITSGRARLGGWKTPNDTNNTKKKKNV